MNAKPAIVLLSGLLFACAEAQPTPPSVPPAPAPAPATAAAPAAPPVQTDHFVNIRAARCDALLALSADDRGEASMFYLGYSARRYGARSVNVGLIPSTIGLALDYCAAEPNRTVADVFAEAYLETRRW